MTKVWDIVKIVLSAITPILIGIMIHWMRKKYAYWKKGRDAVVETQHALFLSFAKDLNEIKTEVKPNGGSSLNDKVSALNTRVIKIDKRLQDMKVEDRAKSEILDVAIWESDKDGLVTYVSMTLCEIFEATQSELLLSSWSGFVAKYDRDRVMKEWDYAIENACEYNIEYDIMVRSDKYQKIKCVAIHIKDENGKILKTLGRVTKIGEPFINK